jgi:hypothetical protein
MKWILLPFRILIRAVCLVALIVMFIPVAFMAYRGGSGGLRD